MNLLNPTLESVVILHGDVLRQNLSPKGRWWPCRGTAYLSSLNIRRNQGTVLVHPIFVPNIFAPYCASSLSIRICEGSSFIFDSLCVSGQLHAIPNRLIIATIKRRNARCELSERIHICPHKNFSQYSLLKYPYNLHIIIKYNSICISLNPYMTLT